MTGNLHSQIRDLQRRKARERRGLLVAEGLRLVEDALAAGADVRGLLVADDVAAGPAAGLVRAAQGRATRLEIVPRKEFDALAVTDAPSGVLAVVAWEPLALAALPAQTPPARPLLVIDGVQDPGNVGTLIRTAYALGAWATVALDGTADVRNPKVVRGSMGALFRHPVAVAHFDAFAAFAAERGLDVLVSAMEGHPPLRGVGPAGAALVVGNEGHGVRAAWSAVPHRRVAIPMRAGAESLNAAVAAGILLYELGRDAD